MSTPLTPSAACLTDGESVGTLQAVPSLSIDFSGKAMDKQTLSRLTSIIVHDARIDHATAISVAPRTEISKENIHTGMSSQSSMSGRSVLSPHLRGKRFSVIPLTRVDTQAPEHSNTANSSPEMPPIFYPSSGASTEELDELRALRARMTLSSPKTSIGNTYSILLSDADRSVLVHHESTLKGTVHSHRSDLDLDRNPFTFTFTVTADKSIPFLSSHITDTRTLKCTTGHTLLLPRDCADAETLEVIILAPSNSGGTSLTRPQHRRKRSDTTLTHTGPAWVYKPSTTDQSASSSASANGTST